MDTCTTYTLCKGFHVSLSFFLGTTALKFPKMEYKGTPKSTVLRKPHPDVRMHVCICVYVRIYPHIVCTYVHQYHYTCIQYVPTYIICVHNNNYINIIL